MDEVADKQAAFRRILPDEKGEAWEKVRILEELEGHLADERVLSFFLGIVADQAEYDMVRLHLLKFFEIDPAATPEDRRRIAECIAAALPVEEDWTVRCWLGRAAQSYGDIPAVFGAAVARVLDESEYEDVRHNCLAVLRYRGPEEAVVSVLRQLAEDNSLLGSAARDTLTRWGVA